MPELPEMENYRQLLTPLIQGSVITHVQVTRPKSLNVEPGRFAEELVGHQVIQIERRAKHLLFTLSTGNVLVLHLMLGGWMFYGTEEEKPERTIQVTIGFGRNCLYFIGLRLGYLHFYTKTAADEMLSKLGPEPLRPEFGFAAFQQALHGKRGNLKVTLVDQSVISGIGNCYSDEICFYAGLLPTRKVPSLAEHEEQRLFQAMRDVLTEAIHYGGYMESPLYNGDKRTGQFDERCRVYDREGEPCVRCGSLLVREEVSSRKCFYCIQCQN